MKVIDVSRHLAYQVLVEGETWMYLRTSSSAVARPSWCRSHEKGFSLVENKDEVKLLEDAFQLALKNAGVLQ